MKFSALLYTLLLVGSAAFTSCSQSASEDTATKSAAAGTTETPATPAKEAVYECPMGCEGSQSAKPGKCPVCGMDLEKKS